jgi:endonuclease YncB( thermonuclease family)
MEVWRLILVPHLIALVLSVPSHSREEFYRVTQIVDGDMFPLANGQRVGLIGIDIPEVHESKKLHQNVERREKNIFLGRPGRKETWKILEGKMDQKRRIDLLLLQRWVAARVLQD